jgi:polyisoprenoid-binding protein YceI
MFWGGVLGCRLTLGVALAQPAPSECSGTATFEASTNVPGISVHGKSDAVKTRLQMQRNGDGILIERIEAWTPVSSLSTGMGLRDDHMRKLVFTTADGKTPDIRFHGENITCPVAPGKESKCKVPGKLSIRDVERPFEVTMKVRQDGGAAYKAAGDAVLKLSDFGIERPSQLGVQAENEVKLHLAFTARPDAALAEDGRRR